MSDQVKSESPVVLEVVHFEDVVFFVSEDFVVRVEPDPEEECGYGWNAVGFGVEPPGEHGVALLWSFHQMVGKDPHLPS